MFIDASGNPVTQSVVGVTDASGNPVTGNAVELKYNRFINVWNVQKNSCYKHHLS